MPRVEPRLSVDADEFSRWSVTNVRAQRLDGWAIVVITTLLGDLTSAQLRLIGELSSVFGDGSVRVTHDQNLVFRWVRTTDVAELYPQFACSGLARPGAGTFADVTSCPGAESCKLAVTQSRGLGRLLAEQLTIDRISSRDVPGLNIKISGCPERMRTASRCGHWLPGKPAQGGRPAGASLLRHGWWRYHGSGNDVRPPCGHHPGPAVRRRARATGSALSRPAHGRGVGAWVLPARRRRDGEDAHWPVSTVSRRKTRLPKISSIWLKTRLSIPRCRKGNAARSSNGDPSSRPTGLLLSTIGRTPLLRLGRIVPDRPGVEIYAKAEFQNPGGSVKDRAARAILEDAEERGLLHPGSTILDATSGNTGIAYAMIAAAHGYRLKLCVPENVTPERLRILRAFGAELVLTDADGRQRRRDPRSAPAAPARVPTATSTPISTTTTPIGARTTTPPGRKSSSRPADGSRTSWQGSARAARSSARDGACANIARTSGSFRCSRIHRCMPSKDSSTWNRRSCQGSTIRCWPTRTFVYPPNGTLADAAARVGRRPARRGIEWRRARRGSGRRRARTRSRDCHDLS